MVTEPLVDHHFSCETRHKLWLSTPAPGLEYPTGPAVAAGHGGAAEALWQGAGINMAYTGCGWLMLASMSHGKDIYIYTHTHVCICICISIDLQQNRFICCFRWAIPGFVLSMIDASFPPNDSQKVCLIYYFRVGFHLAILNRLL